MVHNREDNGGDGEGVLPGVRQDVDDEDRPGGDGRTMSQKVREGDVRAGLSARVAELAEEDTSSEADRANRVWIPGTDGVAEERGGGGMVRGGGRRGAPAREMRVGCCRDVI